MRDTTHYWLAPAAALLLLLPVVAPAAPSGSDIEAPKGIVDCLLPGALRRVGGNFYQMPQRPARITATECTLRGGDFLLYDRANYETTLKHWITQAENGDADAMLYVGEIYEQGIGRDPDYAAAASWYKKAADADNTTAMISLAHLYKTGMGVELDLKTAQALYSEAFGSDIQIPLDPRSVKGADQRVETLVAEVDAVRRQKIAVDLELQAANEQLVNARRALDDALSGDGQDSDLIKDLQVSVAKQQSDIATYQADIDSMKAENAELITLRQQLDEQKIETARLQSLLTGAESEVSRSRDQLSAQQAALDAKESEFNTLLANMRTDQDREKIQASSRELEKHRDQIRTLETALRKAEDERSLYQVLNDEAATQHDRVATLTARITILEQQSSSAEGEFDAMRRELTATRSALDERVAASSESMQGSEAELAARDAEIQRLRASVERAETETIRHRSDINDLSKQSEELEQLRADFEREQAQSNRLHQLLTESQERFAESNTRVLEVNAAQSSLQEEVNELRAGAAAGDPASQALLEQREHLLRTADAELVVLKTRIAESENEFERFQRQMGDTATRQSQAIENLRVAVASGRAEREQLEEKLTSAGQQLTSAYADLALQRQRFDELQDDLREVRSEKNSSIEIVEKKQAQLDSETQKVASLQKEINRLTEQSSRYEQDIDDLKARAQIDTVEFASPSIVLLEPSESLLASTALPTRGGTQTRGISVIAATRLSETKIIRGHVEAPAGLAKLTINGWQVPVDGHNSFTQPLELDSESKEVRIVAVDHRGKQDVKEFEYRIDGTVGQTDGIHNKGTRFQQSRNGALDHLKYYALIIANEDYQNDFLRDLETPVADAEAIKAVLEERYGFRVDVLKNADKDAIEAALERIFYIEENDEIEENDKDAILIYYAGHGFGSDSRNNDAYFWAPVDAEYNSPRTWFKTRELESYMQVSETKQIMVIADSCFAGSVLSRDGLSGDHASLKAKNWRKFLTEYTERKKSRYVLTSGGLAPVLDGGGGDHSVFARAFLDVLSENNEILSASGMHEQVAPIVLNLAERLNFEQTPYFGYLTSAGHGFGNFYLPAPQFSAPSVAAVDTGFAVSDALIVAQVDP